MSPETFSNEQKLFPHHIIEVLDQRDRLRYPVLNGKQITDLVNKKVNVSSTIAAERIAEMRKAGQIEFSELGYNQYVYWLSDEQIIKREPLDKWRSRTLVSLNQVVTLSVAFLVFGFVLSAYSVAINTLSGKAIFSVETQNFFRLTVAVLFLTMIFKVWAYLARKPHVAPRWLGKGIYKHYGLMWIKYEVIWLRSLILVAFGRDAGGSTKIFTIGVKTGPSNGILAVLFAFIIYGTGVLEAWPSKGFGAFGWSLVGVAAVVFFFYGFSKISESASRAISPIVIQQQGIDAITGTEQEMIYGI